MLVEAISEEKFTDDFGVSIDIGETIRGHATRYSQKYIWIEIMLDTAIEPKTEDEFLSGIEVKDVKIKVKKNSIKRLKCEYCNNFATSENNQTCNDENCNYLLYRSRNKWTDYSASQDYSCGGME